MRRGSATNPVKPHLQSRSRYVELFGGLALGDALSAQLSVLFKEVCPFKSIPAWLTVRLVLFVLDEGSHSDLLGQSLAFEESWLRMVRSFTRFNL
jgi:hypothetical protein